MSLFSSQDFNWQMCLIQLPVSMHGGNGKVASISWKFPFKFLSNNAHSFNIIFKVLLITAFLRRLQPARSYSAYCRKIRNGRQCRPRQCNSLQSSLDTASFQSFRFYVRWGVRQSLVVTDAKTFLRQWT